jgi:tricorn protease
MLSAFLALAQNQAADPFDPGSNPYLFQSPTISQSKIVFRLGGDLWSVSRDGGEASRLTTSKGDETNPVFSPDGTKIAFTGQYDGNTDVYVMDANGGEPKRITYHPGGDLVLGWTPDGNSVVFASGMKSNNILPRMFTADLKGGVPKQLPFPSGTMASFSPDMKQIAYVPHMKWQDAWKRYRGGQAYKIWIGQLSDSKVVEIPRKDWNDEQPMWLGNKIYYISDAKGIAGLSCYDTSSKRVSEVIPGVGFDIKHASAGAGVIVYTKLGSLHIYDPETKQSKKVNITVRGDFQETRPAIKDLRPYITGSSISPSGQRALVAARGWVFTVPATKGDPKLIDSKQGVYRRDPAWSPDGRTISYITDENGKQQLALHDVTTGKTKYAELGDSPGYYYGSGASYWSPDSKKIAYSDSRNKLWIHEIETGKNTFVDESTYTDPNLNMVAKWSPDSKWVTYEKDLISHMKVVCLFSMDSGKVTQITDGLSNALAPVFDRDGKHLYFHASTNMGQALSWLDISSLTNPNTTSSVYCVVLRKDLPNPLSPESDEEVVKSTPPPTPPPAAAAAPAAEAPKKPEWTIDLDGIESRIIALPMPPASYGVTEAGMPGSFFISSDNGIMKWSMAERRASMYAPGGQLTVTADGTKALLRLGSSMQIVSTFAPASPGVGAVSLTKLQTRIDPRQEWASIFHEIWRNEPMLFYADNMHGINPETMRKRYQPFLANVISRSDLNFLFTDMLGEMVIGHMWASGGDMPSGASFVPGGLLGADYNLENGKYRIARIYNGERWNPGLQAPLAQPGVAANVGDYILEIDGQPLQDSNDIYQLLEGKAGRQVKVKIGPNADGTGAKESTVIPVASETALRNRAWIEDNRRYVDKMTGGRAGYVHVPDTGGGGWTAFLRYYYAQVGKDGMIVDERYNQGGLITDFFVNEMKKTLDAAFTPRAGKDWPTPGSAIYGPKVMLANEMAGSGGDMFPWLFKHKEVGPVVGKRTWGGLVASFGFPTVDGGNINSPNCAFYSVYSGKWEVEGYGVDPDVDVELDPFLWRQGKDSQLEAAIEEINKMLKGYKPVQMKRPANPDKTKTSKGF